MDIGGAVTRAIARSQRVMFRPFSLGAWFSFGFVFFLASLVDPIGGYSGKLELPDLHPSRSAGAPTTIPDIPDLPPEVATALDQHGVAILSGIAAVIVLGAVLGILTTWVGCRGLMIAYRSTSLGYVGIGEGWRETAKPANALFRFHLLLGAISFLISVPLVLVGGMSVVSAYGAGERDLRAFVRLALPYLVLLALSGLGAGIVLFVTRQFIAPFVLFFSCTVREAWARFFRVLKTDGGGVLAFVFARFVLAFLVGVISSFLAMLTCCIGGLPVLHQTVLAPILFFDRAFTLHALASLGPEYAQMAPELPAYAPTPWRR